MNVFSEKLEALRTEIIESLMTIVARGSEAITFLDDPENDVSGEIFELPYMIVESTMEYYTEKKYIYRVRRDPAIDEIIFYLFSVNDSTTLHLKASELEIKTLIQMEEKLRTYKKQ